jgi:hypothetical protein
MYWHVGNLPLTVVCSACGKVPQDAPCENEQQDANSSFAMK